MPVHRRSAAAARRADPRASRSRRRLRADPRDDLDRADRQGRAGRSRVPVDRRHGERRTAPSASTSRCWTRRCDAALALQARHARRQRHVLRDRPGLGAVGRRAPRRRPADLEARAYAVARAFEPLLVNTVVGFIGPEYLYDGKQIIRAGLEDHFCGKLLGLPMGVDVCYTNHAEADQDDMDTLLTLLGAAGVNYVMGVPGADDVMLNYQSTSFHDALYVREVLGLKRAPEFEAWLAAHGHHRCERPAPAARRAASPCSRQRRGLTRHDRSTSTVTTRSLGKLARLHAGAHRARARGRRAADPRGAALRAWPMRRRGTPCTRPSMRPRSQRASAELGSRGRSRVESAARAARHLPAPARSRPPLVRARAAPGCRRTRGQAGRSRDRHRRRPVGDGGARPRGAASRRLPAARQAAGTVARARS